MNQLRLLQISNSFRSNLAGKIYRVWRTVLPSSLIKTETSNNDYTNHEALKAALVNKRDDAFLYVMQAITPHIEKRLNSIDNLYKEEVLKDVVFNVVAKLLEKIHSGAFEKETPKNKPVNFARTIADNIINKLWKIKVKYPELRIEIDQLERIEKYMEAEESMYEVKEKLRLSNRLDELIDMSFKELTCEDCKKLLKLHHIDDKMYKMLLPEFPNYRSEKDLTRKARLCRHELSKIFSTKLKSELACKEFIEEEYEAWSEKYVKNNSVHDKNH